MSEICGIARFVFHEGKAEEFKRLSQRCMDIVHTKDVGTLGYDIFFNDNESEAIVIERYVDTRALMDHLVNIGDGLMSAIAATAEVSGETLGTIDAELRQRISAQGVRVFTPFLTLG